MEHHLWTRQLARTDQIEKLGFVEIVRQLAIGEIAELVGVLQVVDGEDVRKATLVQRADVVGAHETRSASHDDHDGRG